MPKLTIGMATYRDFHGVYFTLQAVKLYHPEILKDTEFVVVDQAPETAEGIAVKQLVDGFVRAGCAGAKYVPYTERIGTSASRNKVVEEASGKVVVVMDCHVMLVPGAFLSILNYLEDPKNRLDIVSGPILSDAVRRHELDYGAVIAMLETRTSDAVRRRELGYEPGYSVMATHYADYIRAEMWGIWANAFSCTCRKFQFVPVQTEDGRTQFETVTMNPQRVTYCPSCGRGLPVGVEWFRHGQVLESDEYTLAAWDDVPFEIPGQGLGLFAFRKSHWPGFNPDTWGFGGEELYIHEKYRRMGGRAICLPAAAWLHRFPRPEGPSYPNTRWYKARNYVLEYQELGRDLEPMRLHFVGEKKFPQRDWDLLVSDPKRYVHGPGDHYRQPVMVNGVPTHPQTLEEVYSHVYATTKALNEHFPKLRELAAQVNHITEFSKRYETTIAFMAGQPKKLVSHNLEVHDPKRYFSGMQLKTEWIADNLPSVQVKEIEPTDLLYIDSVHHADHLRRELTSHGPKVSRYIVCRSTRDFGMVAEGGGPGLFEAMKEFLQDNPEWFVCYHNPQQYGLTVLSRNPLDRPEEILRPWPKGYGPGTELIALLESIGITSSPTCDCKAKARMMDEMGVDGCRQNKEMIVDWLRKGQDGWGWKDKMAAAAKAVKTGLAFKLNPLDPFPTLIEEAIRRAELKEGKQ